MQIDAYRHRPEGEAQHPNTKLGDYFVSALDGKRFALVSGPYVNDHAAAISDINECRSLVEEIDPRAVFYAFGTCRLKNECGKIGFLQRQKLKEILSKG